jgi:hypothetical protein
MAKNNQKKEKALRNLENARKYRKKTTDKRRRFSGPRPVAPGSASQPAVAFQSSSQSAFIPNPEA